MARRKKPGIVRKIIGLPSYCMKKPVKSAWTAVKIAVIGAAAAGTALYLYTTFSPRYGEGVQQPTGIEKIARDAENVYTDAARNISDYLTNETQTPSTKYQE